jgi:hypothetical protein
MRDYQLAANEERPVSATRQELLERIGKLDETQQGRVLEFVRGLEAPSRPRSARELIRLPQEMRRQFVQAAFAEAASEDFELFEAYSEESSDDAP